MYIMTDEGFAFDYLSILQVKLFKLGGDNSAFERCRESLKSQLTPSFFKEIYNSQEYAALYQANMRTFDAVEKARYGEISAKEVDNCNMDRYNCKVALRKKFFPSSAQIELKS